MLSNMDDFEIARVKQIQAMDDGPEKDAAWAAITAEYPELTTSLRDDITQAESMINTVMPTSRVAGPGGNPFAVEIANPFGSAAAGAKQYMGHKERKERRGDLDKLSADESEVASKVIRAGLKNPALMQAQAGRMRLSPEQQRILDEEEKMWRS